ncbi:uncharacterized protein [Watersipora subatra]|uniref:uncharacterized protein n=1 Tax=Watersipora subatra TaxID=2589382 RepID=UPI00355BD2E8
MSERLVKYTPPSWASHLQHIPKHFVQLATKPTPIQRWNFPGTPEQFEVYVKRGDLTGSLMTGNKVRRLEFVIAEAMERSCKHILTTGTVTSNQCRATAVACAELGLKAHLFLMSKEKEVSALSSDGNMLINRMVGADMCVIDTLSYTEACTHMEKLAKQIKESTGELSSIIHNRDSNLIGIWGYIQCFQEIRDQGIELDDLVCVSGTAATVSGLAIGNYLTGSGYRVHGIKVGMSCDPEEVLNDMLDGLGITGVTATDIASFHGGYEGLGYGINQPQELEFIGQVAANTGVILDPTYTGKAAYGLQGLLNDKPEVFKGRRVLFMFSGGAPSLHAAAVSSALLPHATKSQ